MNLVQALILGIVQGLTEFFPISSSAHLKMARSLLGASDDQYFDLVCHAGTLLALVTFLYKDVWDVLKAPKKWGPYIIALLPLVPAYFLLKPLRIAASDPKYLWYMLAATSGLLFLGSSRKSESKKRGGVLFVGVMQTLALIPGISRSGSTITAGKLSGWSWVEAARFSFILSIPAILGGLILESLHGEMMATPSIYLAGFLSALFVGLFSVRFVFWMYEKTHVKPFAWYCLFASLVAWSIYG